MSKRARKAAAAGDGDRPKATRKKPKGKTRPAAEPPLALPAPGGQAPLFSDAAADLLGPARTHWQYGAWPQLAALDRDGLDHHPDRAKLALLAAAGHMQAGALPEARRAAARALGWGVDRGLAARVLAAAVHATLGRVAALIDDDAAASTHTRASVALVEPGADVALLARTRDIRERARLGLLPDAARLIGEDVAAARAEPALNETRLEMLRTELEIVTRALSLSVARGQIYPTAAADDSAAPGLAGAPGLDPALADNPRFDARAFAAWGAAAGDGQPDFLYLDVKSLPRSGLHYMRNTLDGILQKGFSFCEWYTEPGCCGRMPCSVTGFRTAAGSGSGRPLLRMVKSHDLDLTDPDYPPGGAIRRVVLVRDPLYILSSWWVLQQLYWNQDLLKKHGVNVTKISYQHEAPVLATAYDILSAHAAPPPVARTETWLAERKAYILRFAAKWGGAAGSGGRGPQAVVPYAGIDAAIGDLLAMLMPVMPAAARARATAFLGGDRAPFAPRRDPFAAPTAALTQYLHDHAALFRTTADAILREDGTGVLQACVDGR